MIADKRIIKNITDNVSITIKENKVYLHLKKHIPVIINAEDKYRKGILIDLCDKCSRLRSIALFHNNKHYCENCVESIMEGEKNGNMS